MARAFKVGGADSLLVMSPGGLSGLDGGPITIACITKLNFAGGGGDGGAIVHALPSAGAGRFDLQIFAGNWYYETDDTNAQSLFAASTADNWTLIAATKAGGTATPRGHKYVYDTATWSHVDAAGTVPDAAGTIGSGGSIQIGRWSTGTAYLDADVAIIGIWGRTLADAEIENLAFSLQSWYHTAPDALWLLDQANVADKVLDLTGGGANESSRTATTVSTNSVPVFGYGFDSLATRQPVAAPASIPYNPQRASPQRDAGEAWWLQRDRRDANTVATPANPLPSPLDSAWQAGGGYWHLYNDAADAAPRTWQSLQRSYVSDPALLVAAGTDPLGMPTGPAGDAAAYWDRRQVPQQPQRGPDPALLLTALLENELLGGGDTAKRTNTPATHVGRRLVPQQRVYVSPVGLLDTALLEAELLGGADTAKRAAVPATHADRREVPQQRAYLSTPGQLDTAQLENELLGGADTGKRAAVPVTHAPRWWAPQQPERETLSFDAGPDVPPLTLTWGAGGRYWALYNQAGWQPDRREVPQQRVYISDPSFYPTVPPLDPLTVAWGASGPYWLLYNTAALQVSRRLVPQQRERESDPGLLLTALLENELLGGADDLARHRHAAVYTDRREAPQQRVYDDPALLATALLEGVLLGGADLARHTFAATLWDRRETPAQRPYGTDPALYGVDADPLLLAGGVGGDAWRRTNTAAYGDRRQVPTQPTRSTVYFDAGPGSPPLTISWGAGGNLWHLYRWRRTARSWWPPRPLFALLGDPCTVIRPSTGTTGRPGTGITARPDTGITEDPC